MWNVECARCGETISAESPSEIKEDENGDPRHEDCPYAEDPSYPLEFSVRTKLRYALESVMKENFPHLTPRIEDDDCRMEFPHSFKEVGNVSLQYRASSPEDKEGTIWNANLTLLAVDGVPLADTLPRIVYECEGCGEQIDGQVHYLTDGYTPLTHSSCSNSSNPTMKPVEISHLDRNTPPEEEEETLEEYKNKYEDC